MSETKTQEVKTSVYYREGITFCIMGVVVGLTLIMIGVVSSMRGTPPGHYFGLPAVIFGNIVAISFGRLLTLTCFDYSKSLKEHAPQTY